MQTTATDLEAWNKCHANGEETIGDVRLAVARPHGIYAKLLPYLNEHPYMTMKEMESTLRIYGPDNYGFESGSSDVRDTLKFLEQLHNGIAAATPSPFEERRRNIVAHVRRIDDCLEKGLLPYADADVDVVAKFPPPKEKENGFWEVHGGGGEFAFRQHDCYLDCLAVPDWKVRMSKKLGYVPDI
ncbi:MAG: hypothetical protein Q9170_005002 [Blastenia crenularia]